MSMQLSARPGSNPTPALPYMVGGVALRMVLVLGSHFFSCALPLLTALVLIGHEPLLALSYRDEEPCNLKGIYSFLVSLQVYINPPRADEH